jgi:multidrug efflux pump subunit AcrA (membrane-fusion protein)
MKKLLLILLILLAVGVLVYFTKAPTFTTVHPHRGPIVEAVYGLGKVKSHHRFDVILGVMNTVKDVYVEEGDPVKVGDKLIAFEGSTFKSPINGTVTLLKVRKGEIAVPMNSVLRVENIQDRYIELSLEQQAALRIRKGQKAKVSFESVRGKILMGEITAIFPREDEFLAQVSVPSLDETVLPGMTADVSVEVGKIENALLIPYKVVSSGIVNVKRGRSWNKEKIDLGIFDGNFIEVKSGLNEVDELRMRKED